MTSLATGPCLGLKCEYPLAGVTFKPVRGIDHDQNISAVVEYFELSWHDGHFCDLELDSWVRQLINVLS